MGLTQKLGTIPLAISTDASNNIGIGGSPSGSYKLEVTGTAKVSSTLLVSGALTGAGEILTSGGQLAFSGSGGAPSTGIGIRYNGTFYVYAGANGFNVRNSANSTNNLTIADSGAATFSSTITSGGTVSVNPTSVGFLTLGASANYGSVSSGGGGATLYLNGATRGGTGGATSSCVTLATDSFFQVTDGSTNNAKFTVASDGTINMNAPSGNKLVTVKGQTGNGYYGEVRLGNVDHSAGIIGRHISSGNADLEFWTEAYSAGGYTKKMTITSSGNIGAPTGTNIYNASDARFKQNITTVENGLNKIIALNPVKFNWLDGFEPSEDGKDMLGFIAQEVQNIIPEAVENFGNNSVTVGEVVVDNPLRVNEKFIIPILVKAIQELSSQNQDLKSRLDKAGL